MEAVLLVLRALPYQDIPDLVRRLAAKGGMAARTLAFTILTIAWETMTLASTWTKIHDDLWVLDAARMKKRAFRQLLSSEAMAIGRPGGGTDEGPRVLTLRGCSSVDDSCVKC